MAQRDLFYLSMPGMEGENKSSTRLSRPHTALALGRQAFGDQRKPLAPLTNLGNSSIVLGGGSGSIGGGGGIGSSTTFNKTNVTIATYLPPTRITVPQRPTSSLPTLGKFKAKNASMFEALENKKKGDGQQQRQRSRPIAKPPTAWGETHVDPFELFTDNPPESPPKRQRIDSKQYTAEFVSTSLQSIQSSLMHQQLTVAKDESNTRHRIIRNANAMVHGLPLSYLYFKPELRHYALEQIYERFLVFARLHARNMLRRAIRIWKVPPNTVCNDRQIGLIVIAQAFQQLLDNTVHRAFKHWLIFYSSRFNTMRQVVVNQAAGDIQRWYRIRVSLRKVAVQRFLHAVSLCVQRRKAMKDMIQYEMWYKKALIKMTRGIVHRRRMHFCARSIQRIYRWFKWCRRVRWKMIRFNAARCVQRFWRMELLRPDRDHVILRAIVNAGGYSKVMNKLNPKLKESMLLEQKAAAALSSPVKRRRAREAAPAGLLFAVDSCARIIQKAWMRYRGLDDEYLSMVQAHEEKARMALLNECAIIIQNNYRAHLWTILERAAWQHNRARRIQRSFRSYLYRKWTQEFFTRSRIARIARMKRIRSRFLRHALLHVKFVLRRKFMDLHETKRRKAAILLGNSYLRYKERLRQWKINDVKRRSALRDATGDATSVVSKIQRNWRQTRETSTCMARSGETRRFTVNRFSYHVLLLMANIDRRRRMRLNRAARCVQRIFMDCLIYHRTRRERIFTAALVTIRRLFKSAIARFGLYHKVITKRALKVVLANRMKYWWRRVLFRHQIKVQSYLMRERLDQEAFVFQTATRIQKALHQKWSEFYAPLRIASRNQIKKRIERDEANRIWQQRDQASRRIQKAFHGVVHWNQSLRRINTERVYYQRHNAALVIQKFFRMVLAWSRFWTKADERQIKNEADARKQRLHDAAGVVGFYWRRWKEKKVLRTMFKLRRKMLDEYYRLTDARLKAEIERKEALDEVERSEATMMATVAASWRQGSDIQGRNYFYNYITGESSWTPPESWKIKPSEMWVRNKDDRDNVYYYNMQTGESRWLPPCCICGQASERFCTDCGVSFCVHDYDGKHTSETMKLHTWTNIETEKEPLKPGEAHCVECKKRVAKVMCSSCWDPYCVTCFKYVHTTGALKHHIPINYRKAKNGWSCIKAQVEGERDYFVNGQTGETSYEKPIELMTPQEKIYFDNFKLHQAAGEEHIKKIDKLQYDLEAASYERDTILFDALNGTGKVGQLLKNRNGGKDLKQVKAAAVAAPPRKKGIMGAVAKLMGDTRDEDEYRQLLMTTDPRVRGNERDKYIQGVIDSVLQS